MDAIYQQLQRFLRELLTSAQFRFGPFLAVGTRRLGGTALKFFKFNVLFLNFYVAVLVPEPVLLYIYIYLL